MLTREETIKAFECCYMAHSCRGCPLDKQMECSNVEPGVNRAVMHYLKENEPAPAATDRSSEVSKDTDNIHLNDSTLLDICREGMREIAASTSDFNDNDGYICGYANAALDIVERLRGGDNNG